MADHVVVELLLTLAIPYKDVKEPAKAILAPFGNLKAILAAPLWVSRNMKTLTSLCPRVTCK